MFLQQASYTPSFGGLGLRNSGGPYDSIHVSNPASWVTVSGYSSLSEDDELPLRVDVEMRPSRWGKSYTETISVSLDEQEIQVSVELSTRIAPRSGRAPKTTTVKTGPTPRRTSVRPSPATGASKYMPGYFQSHASDGMSRGLNWGAVVGAAAMALVGAAVVFRMDEHLFAKVLMTPAFAVIAGLVGGIGGGFVGAIVGMATGTTIAWMRRADPR